MNKVTLLNETEKQAVIKRVRDFLQQEGIDQRDFAVRVGKTETTVSRWLSGKYPITKRNADAIDFIIDFHPKTNQLIKKPDEIQLLTLKASLINHIMQHPAICQQCKVEAYKVIQEFQPA